MMGFVCDVWSQRQWAPVPCSWAQPPNCSSADLAGVMTGVMASTTAYLYTHPPVNAFFTTLGDLDREQKRIALAEFLDANPQVKAELQAIRQPTADFRDRCGVQVPDMADS